MTRMYSSTHVTKTLKKFHHGYPYTVLLAVLCKDNGMITSKTSLKIIYIFRIQLENHL